MKRYLLILAVVLYSSQGWGGNLYVPGGYSTIQGAIDSANNGDHVVVARGRYVENINFQGKAIIVRSTNPDDPNTVAATIIDGSEPDDPNYASVVTFNNGEDNTSILTGFTITGGTGTWVVIAWDLHAPYWNRCGGGVVCYNMSEPTIAGNVFTGNVTGEGGGVYVYGDPIDLISPKDPPIHLEPVIINNTFDGNIATEDHGFDPPNNDYPPEDHGDGGAIVCFQGVDAVIVGNVIKNNYADWYGGGIHLRQWSNGLIEDNQILDNESALGVGIHITYTSSPGIRMNVIQGNATGYSDLGGAGIYVYYHSDPLIERNLITQNVSKTGSGIGVFYSSNPIIRNNLIVDNAGSAGISVSSSKPVIVNNTITGNISTSLFSGGIDCFSSYPAIIENNIIASNGDSFGIYASDAIPTIRHNNVWGHKDGNYNSIIGDRTAIDGNVSVDPEFAGVDDFRLALSSPCINAGDPNRIPEIQTTDYYGNSRLLGNCIDIGASEVYPAWNTTSEEQYASIQDAIDDAGAFDVIVLTRGRHVGQGNRDIDTAGKAVTVRSVDPQDAEIVANTIIDSQGSPQEPHRGFYFHSGENANTILDGLTITGGGGAYEGGAISCTNGSSPAIRNCDIRNNHVTENGGGVFSRNSRPNITNCIIADNSANGENRHGGGAYFCTDGAATPSNAVVANCTVIGNSAGGRGGGLDACWSNPAYINCTIVGNTARQGGGASSFNQADPSIVNCIVRDNRALYGSQLAMINTLESQGVNTTTSMSVGHSDIQGYTDEVYIDVECILSWSSGNFDMDPDFVDSGYWDDADTVAEPNDDVFISGNYHLLPTSPCINAGNNNPLEPLPAVDIDGETRISDDTVDVGVDEVVIKPADLDLNGRVDMQDMLVVITQWLITGPEMQGDLNKDSFIDNADYAGVAEQWLWKGGWHQESP